MALAAIAFSALQYEGFANQYIKAFEQGTTTPKVMATDATGATTASKFQLNAQGFPVTDGSTKVIPFIDGAYDLWVFPTAAEADANDTTNADQIADNITASPFDDSTSIVFTQAGSGAVETTVEAKLNEVPSLFDFMTTAEIADVQANTALIDVSVAVKAALDANTTGRLLAPAGTYLIPGTGVTLVSNVILEGTDKTFFKSTNTFFDDTGVGVAKFTIGQGNVFNGTSLTNVVLKNITIIGGYEASFGEQNVFANTVTAGLGNRLLFLLTCNDVTLDNFHIKESFSSEVGNIGTFEQNTLITNGQNQIFITSCTGVNLLNCTWTLSIGEAWSLWDCDNVTVDNCRFDNDFGISMLDVTYCTHVSVTNSKFLKRLASDSGDLLNVASAFVDISNNSVLNGSIDVGNEFLNVNSVLGASFQMENIVVASNSIFNGAVNMSMGSGTFNSSLAWASQNVTISDNTIISDIDVRPAANGSTVLNYSAINLPNSQNCRNIKIEDNNITIRGALQSSGASVNKWTAIRGLIDSSIGDIRENITIKGNTITADFTGYDSDDLNDVSGAIVFEFGVWNNLIIKDNDVDAPTFILFSKNETINGLTIAGNDVKAESFLNAPLFAANNTDINDMDIYDNRFTFFNTAGHTYDSSDIGTRGYGAFISMTVSPITLIENGRIRDNVIEAASFAFITNATASTSVKIRFEIMGNTTTFVDYAASSSTTFPINLGRADSTNQQATFYLEGNYFKETATTAKTITMTEFNQLDMMNNTFIGTFTFSLVTDDLSSDTTSRFIFKDNYAIGTTIMNITNVNSTVNKLVRGNSSTLDFGFAITDTINTIGVFYDDAASTFKAFDGTAFKTVAVT